MESKEHRTKSVNNKQSKNINLNILNVAEIEKEGFDGDNNL